MNWGNVVVVRTSNKNTFIPKKIRVLVITYYFKPYLKRSTRKRTRSLSIVHYRKIERVLSFISLIYVIYYKRYSLT